MAIHNTSSGEECVTIRSLDFKSNRGEGDKSGEGIRLRTKEQHPLCLSVCLFVCPSAFECVWMWVWVCKWTSVSSWRALSFHVLVTFFVTLRRNLLQRNSCNTPYYFSYLFRSLSAFTPSSVCSELRNGEWGAVCSVRYSVFSGMHCPLKCVLRKKM